MGRVAEFPKQPSDRRSVVVRGRPYLHAAVREPLGGE